MLGLRNFPVPKRFMVKTRGEAVSRYSVESFSSLRVEHFRRGTLLCCVSETFRYRKNLLKRGGRRVSRVFVENFLSHIAEKFLRGNLLCYVSKNFR